MNNKPFVIIGSGLLAWSVVLSAVWPNGSNHMVFIYAGLALILAPIYTKIRLEKNTNGFKLFVDSPSVSELTEHEISLHKINMELLKAKKDNLEDNKTIDVGRIVQKTKHSNDENESLSFGAIVVFLAIVIFSWYIYVTPPQDEVSKFSSADLDISWVESEENKYSPPININLINKAETSYKGIKIFMNEGQPVRSIGKGKVAYSGDGLQSYEQLIIIKHSKTYLSAYAHLGEFTVKEGDEVKKGQQIGNIGRKGLVFEIRENGMPVKISEIGKLIGFKYNNSK